VEFIGFTSTGGYALSEGSIFERLRRDPHLPADPQIFHSSLIYEVGFADALEKIHRSYWDIAQRHYLPMLAFSDTWRANRERIEKSRFNTRSVNQDNIRFLQAIRSSYGSLAAPIFIAGQIGPYGNAYRPAEALPSQEAQAFHTWQINALA